jgi:hypothetical protein
MAYYVELNQKRESTQLFEKHGVILRRINYNDMLAKATLNGKCQAPIF